MSPSSSKIISLPTIHNIAKDRIILRSMNASFYCSVNHLLEKYISGAKISMLHGNDYTWMLTNHTLVKF